MTDKKETVKELPKFLLYLLIYPLVLVIDIMNGLFYAANLTSTTNTMKDITIMFSILAVLGAVLKLSIIVWVFGLLALLSAVFHLYQKGEWRELSLKRRWKKVNPEDLGK